MSWRGILTIVLLFAAAITGWSVWQQRDKTDGARAVTARSDYVLNDFEIITLNSRGTEAFTLRAPRMDRNPDDKTMTLVTPLFLFPDKDGAHWQTRSQTGWVSANGDEVRLRGAVKVDSPQPSSNQVAMTTEQLNVFPDAKRANSPVLVTVTQPGSTMRGIGMRVDMASKQYELLSQVSTRYDPSRR